MSTRMLDVLGGPTATIQPVRVQLMLVGGTAYIQAADGDDAFVDRWLAAAGEAWRWAGRRELVAQLDRKHPGWRELRPVSSERVRPEIEAAG